MFLLIAENAEEPEEDDDHFNTSHVSINLIVNILHILPHIISIHLMFLLIKEWA